MDNSRVADLQVRSILCASSDTLCRALHVAQLDRDLVATLYIRMRDTLEQWHGASDKDLAEQLTLTLYLTAAAWGPLGNGNPDLLASLRVIIVATLGTPGAPQPKHQFIEGVEK